MTEIKQSAPTTVVASLNAADRLLLTGVPGFYLSYKHEPTSSATIVVNKIPSPAKPETDPVILQRRIDTLMQEIVSLRIELRDALARIHVYEYPEDFKNEDGSDKHANE